MIVHRYVHAGAVCLSYAVLLPSHRRRAAYAAQYDDMTRMCSDRVSKINLVDLAGSERYVY